MTGMHALQNRKYRQRWLASFEKHDRYSSLSSVANMNIHTKMA